MEDSWMFAKSSYFGFRTIAVISLALALSGAATAQNAVIDWNAIAVTTALNGNPSISPGSATAGGTGLYLAYMHLAIYDAVNAIDHRFQSYGPEIPAPAGASTDAAVISAAYNTLVSYFSDQSASLTTQYTSALAVIPDGQAKDDGVQVGKAAANSIIAMRAGDGRGANVPYLFPAVPTAGVWIPTPPAQLSPLTPWVGQMVPFTMTSASQFLPDEPPPALTSTQWADDYNQVKTLGAVNSVVRTAQQTEIGLFWTEQTSKQYARAFRALAAGRALSTSDTARLFAMVWTAFSDSFIGCMNAKYHFSFWRPVTAIQNGGIDGNSATVPDQTWTPLGTTPNHPEYPANHGCVSGAVATILKGYFGTPNVNFTVSSTVFNPAHVHTFNSTKDLEQEVGDARIYAGFHYHHSVVQGFVLGQHVAQHVLVNFFQPVASH
jgi:PAP2 superfamily protein